MAALYLNAGSKYLSSVRSQDTGRIRISIEYGVLPLHPPLCACERVALLLEWRPLRSGHWVAESPLHAGFEFSMKSPREF